MFRVLILRLRLNIIARVIPALSSTYLTNARAAKRRKCQGEIEMQECLKSSIRTHENVQGKRRRESFQTNGFQISKRSPDTTNGLVGARSRQTMVWQLVGFKIVNNKSQPVDRVHLEMVAYMWRSIDRLLEGQRPISYYLLGVSPPPSCLLRLSSSTRPLQRR